MEIFMGFYIGCLSMILLYNLHWYQITKEKSYIYYALFKAVMILIMLQNLQIIVIHEFFLIFNANVIFVVMLMFSKEFLDLKKNHKNLNLLLNASIVFVLLCFAYSLSSGNFDIYSLPYSLVFSPLILIGAYVYKQGFEAAKYYVIAWGIALTLIGIYDLNQFSVLQFYPNIPFDAVGNIVESIIMSYAIFVKTNLIIEDKEQQSKILIHQARLASMGRMLESISHQWRQPLNRISTYIINMRVYIDNKYQDEHLIKELKQSQLQLDYMSDTINDFTDFNKPSKNKEKFLASTVISDAYKIVDDTLEENKIEFEIDHQNDFSIYSYKNELAQVVLNLIQNAQDELLKRQVPQPKVKIVISNNKISVQDNAGGIEKDVIDHIFDPYFTTKSEATSLGLGLYMSKVILDKYFNAKIEVVQIKQATSFDILFDS